MAGVPEPAWAVVMIAAGVVLALAIALIVAIASVPSLPAPASWLLLLLAMTAGVLAILHQFRVL